MTTTSRFASPSPGRPAGSAIRWSSGSPPGGCSGPSSRSPCRLLELPDARAALEACAMELKDCAFPLLTELTTGIDSSEAFDGADWIILLGGKPFSPISRAASTCCGRMPR